MRSSQSPSQQPVRRAAGRPLRRLAYWSAGPVAAGTWLALAAVGGVHITGPAQWLTTGLSLTPAVLVHCHQRDRNFTWLETCAAALAAAVVAYVVMVVGVITGAALTLAIYVAAQTGVLAYAAQLSAIVGMLTSAFSRPRDA